MLQWSESLQMRQQEQAEFEKVTMPIINDMSNTKDLY